MKREIIAILMLTTLTGLLIVAGCGDAIFPQSDVIVYKTDPNGTVEWSVNLNTGLQDSTGAVIETSDGGYLWAGGISNHDNHHINPAFPRMVKLDAYGHIQWDLTLNSTTGNANYTGTGMATTVLEKSDGDFLAGLDNGWILTITPGGTVENITALDNRRMSAITTQDGGILIVGDKTMKFDAAGNLTWEKPLKESTSVFQTHDGRYLMDHDMGWNDTGRGVTSLAPDGTSLWTYNLGSWSPMTGTSFHESSPGNVDFTYSSTVYGNPGMTQSAMTKQQTFDRYGNVIAAMNLSATGALARTLDNGYVFMGIPLSDSGKFTSVYAKNSILHIVKLSAGGNKVWDKPLTPAGYYYPHSVIRTRDGGYIALVGLDVLRVE